MRKCLVLLLLIFIVFGGVAQRVNPAIDTLQKQLTKAKPGMERVYALGKLSKVYVNENLQTSDSIGKQMIEEAEMSRDRKLMAEALLTNGDRNSFLATRKENFTKAITYYNQALELSRENNLDKEIVRSYIALSAIYRMAPDAEKAYTYASQADSHLSVSGNDSLQVLASIEMGNVENLKRQKLMALQSYLKAQRIAEGLKDVSLKRTCYNALTGFYSGIENYDKAIDNALKALQLLDELKDGNSPYNRPIALNAIASLYAQKKNYDVANYYLQQSIKLADSLHYEPLKIPAYMGIINNNLLSGKPEEALAYLNNNNEVKVFAAKFGLQSQIDYAYGYIYTSLGKYDSARSYYAKAAPFFENSSTEASRYLFYYQLASMYKLSGDNKKAIENFLKAKEVADKVADPERIKLAAKELDTLYMNAGDYRQSQFFSSMYYQYKDSIEQMGKEKDLISEVDKADEMRRKKELEEAEANRRRKNNIQYTAITIGIVVLLILLVVLGMFRVSAGFIKALGFFVFLMLFEFIFLVFKKNIHSFTHGEPWKDLAFMIALAALLVPLHHWVEHKVLHYLTSHNRLTQAGHHIKNKLFKRSNE